jgi:crotonobetainyl-CoA:carnitine CoA-transferase CaiB-like acyl-CoA transferase
VLSPADAIAHPWFVEQGVVRQVTDPEGGTFAIPGFPIRFGGIRPEAPLAAATLGQHTAEVLAMAGLDEVAARAAMASAEEMVAGER